MNAITNTHTPMTDEIAQRLALSEGYMLRHVVLALKNALDKNLRVLLELTEAGQTCNNVMSIEEMVGVLTATQYRGGHAHPGTVVSPSRFQEEQWQWAGPKDADPDGARTWLEAHPDGTEVRESYDVGNGVDQTLYRKVDGSWVCIWLYCAQSHYWAVESRGYTPGIRQQVQQMLEVNDTTYFHHLFDQASETLA